MNDTTGVVGVKRMMQQNIVPPQFFEKVLRLGGEVQFAGNKRLEFQFRMSVCS